jgi:zinc protease
MDRTKAPETNAIQSVNIPAYKLVHLDNGVPVYVINEGEQEVLKMELMFKAGKWFEEKNLVADFTNRMLREGTGRLNNLQIAEAFDYYGANITTSAGFENAGAVLYTLPGQVNNVLPVLYEILSEPSFPKYELDTIITNRKQKLLVDLKRNEFLANRNFVNALFGQQHPYGRVTEPEHLDSIEVKDLERFFKKYYNASNLVIMLSGKFNEDVLEEINRYFGKKEWIGAKADDNIVFEKSPAQKLIHHVEKTDSVQSAIITGNVSINKTHPDFLKLSVLNTVFGGYFGSRLMGNIREEKGYTYGIYSSFVSYAHAGFFEIVTEVGKEVKDATFAEIEKEINLLRTEKIEQEELETVRNYMTGKILRSLDGPLKFSETLKGLVLYNQDIDYIHRLLDTISCVSAEELLELANKYLDFSKMYKISVG